VAVRALTILASSLALVLGVGSVASASTSSQLCPPRHDGGGPPGTQTGDPTKDGSCNSAIFWGRSTGSVVKTTSAGPNDSIVSPGETITVTLKWDRRQFGWLGPAETEDCVQIGNKISKLSQEHGRAPLNGTDTFTYTVPADTGGQQICDRGVVWGYGSTGGDWSSDGRGEWNSNQSNHGPQKSAILCYSVLGAATPEAPSVLLFPMAALFIVGGGYVVTRRRRTATALHKTAAGKLNP
jgi:hypothetical protein